MERAAQLTPQPMIAPGPHGLMLLGSLLDIRRDRLKFLLGVSAQYGDIARFRMGSMVLHLVFQPDYIKHVLQDNYANYHKGIGLAQSKPFLGDGLLTNEGSGWLQQRRLMQPAFHRQRIAEFATQITAATEAMLRQWQRRAGTPLDVAPEMMELTLTILSRALFSTEMQDVARALGDALTVALEQAIHRMVAVVDLPQSWPTPRNRRFRRALQTLDAVVFKMIEDRRSGRVETGDLLTMLLQARDAETGQGMSQRQLRDEIMTILFAGHETTAVALSWVWHLLAQHPEVADRLHAEVTAVLGGRTPTLQDLPQLKYTRMVIDEALRLYPPVWLLPRKAVADDQLGPYHIPAGSGVLISPYAMQRHPAFWERPDVFDPQRFAEERSARRPQYAYFPFGGGPRYCIGSSFALLEAQLIVAMVSQRFELQALHGHTPQPDPLLTLRPRHGILMRLRPRSG